MQHNTKIIIALVLAVLAGALFGYGIGATDQYKVTASWFEQQADKKPVLIQDSAGNRVYTIHKLNDSEFNVSISDCVTEYKLPGRCYNVTEFNAIALGFEQQTDNASVTDAYFKGLNISQGFWACGYLPQDQSVCISVPDSASDEIKESLKEILNSTEITPTNSDFLMISRDPEWQFS